MDASREARAEHRLRGEHHRPSRRKRLVAPPAALRVAHRFGPRRRQLRRTSRIHLGDRGRADAGRALHRHAPSARGRDLAERGRRPVRQPRGERPAHHARAQDRLEQRQDRRGRDSLHRRRSRAARRRQASRRARSPATSSCTSSRAARSTRRRSTSASSRESSGSSSGRSRSPDFRTTPARPRWTSGTTRCSRPRASWTW